MGVLLSGCRPSQSNIDAATQLVIDAKALVSGSRFADAMNSYESAMEEDSGNVDIYTGIAEIYVIKNRPDDARDVLKTGVGKSREKSQAYRMWGQIELTAGDAKTAVTYLRNAVQRDKSDDEARYYLARAYVNDNDFEKGADEAAKISEDGGEWFVRGGLLSAALAGTDIESARASINSIKGITVGDDLADSFSAYDATLSRVENLSDDEKTDEYVAVILSYAALQAGYEDIVLDTLSGYASDESEYGDLYLYLGEAYYMNMQYEEAADALTDAVTLNPVDAVGPLFLARASGQLGASTQMKESYLRAIALAPDEDRGAIREEYAEALQEESQFSAADEQWRLLVEEDPDQADKYELMRVSLMLTQSKYDDAQNLLDDLDVSGMPDGLAAKYNWAVASVEFSGANFSVAGERINEAITLQGDVPEYHLMRGAIYFEIGDEANASAELEKAIDLDVSGKVSADANKILDRI